MLKIGSNEIAWADISEVTLFADDSGIEVSVTVDETVLAVGVYETADHATSVKNVLEASRVASSFGGVIIVIEIDDL